MALREKDERIYLCCFATKTGMKEAAAAWLRDKEKVPQEAYLACMETYCDKNVYS